jgi:hypothetical protein
MLTTENMQADWNVQIWVKPEQRFVSRIFEVRGV